MRGLRIVTTSLSELTMIIFSIMERGSGEEPCCPNLVGDLGVPGGQYRTEAGYNVRHADRATCSRLFKLMEHVRQLNEGSLLSIRHGQPLHLRGSRLRGWHAPRLDRVSRRQRLECQTMKQLLEMDTRNNAFVCYTRV